MPCSRASPALPYVMSLSSPRAAFDALVTPEPPAAAVPVLDTPRLRLRAIARDDLDDLYELLADPVAARRRHLPPLEDREDACIALETIHRGYLVGDRLEWGVCLAGATTLVGTCTLTRVDAAHARAELVCLLAPALRGQGLAREALHAVARHAFGPLGLRRLESEVDPRDLRALRALGALGFKREGLLRQRWLVDGRWQDSLLLGLLAEELAEGE